MAWSRIIEEYPKPSAGLQDYLWHMKFIDRSPGVYHIRACKNVVKECNNNKVCYKYYIRHTGYDLFCSQCLASISSGTCVAPEKQYSITRLKTRFYEIKPTTSNNSNNNHYSYAVTIKDTFQCIDAKICTRFRETQYLESLIGGVLNGLKTNISNTSCHGCHHVAQNYPLYLGGAFYHLAANITLVLKNDDNIIKYVERLAPRLRTAVNFIHEDTKYGVAYETLLPIDSLVHIASQTELRCGKVSERTLQPSDYTLLTQGSLLSVLLKNGQKELIGGRRARISFALHRSPYLADISVDIRVTVCFNEDEWMRNMYSTIILITLTICCFALGSALVDHERSLALSIHLLSVMIVGLVLRYAVEYIQQHHICLVAGIATHYNRLVQILWLATVTVHYLYVVRKKKDAVYYRYYLCCYGLPFVIVLTGICIMLGVPILGFKYTKLGWRCWMPSLLQKLTTFLLPIFLVTIYVFAQSAYTVYEINKKRDNEFPSQSRTGTFFSAIFHAIVLLLLCSSYAVIDLDGGTLGWKWVVLVAELVETNYGIVLTIYYLPYHKFIRHASR